MYTGLSPVHGRSSSTTSVVATTPATATHLICWRTSGSARRERTTREIAVNGMLTTNPIMAIDPMTSMTVDSTPTGLVRAGISSVKAPGVVAAWITPAAAQAMTSQSSGRHLGLGRVPSGNTSRISGRVAMAGMNNQVPSQPPSVAPGRS